jgi:hypothetical protein
MSLLEPRLGAATNVLFIHSVTFVAAGNAEKGCASPIFWIFTGCELPKYGNFSLDLVNNKKTQFLD